jgi:methylphosphotriester-DNA--protein-cysteine methyltransferase
MVSHHELGNTPFSAKRELVRLIASAEVTLAGYKKGKIYGLLSCKSGKRMHAKNRVFFKDEQEARASGYRPCGTCMRAAYQSWLNRKQIHT